MWDGTSGGHLVLSPAKKHSWLQGCHRLLRAESSQVLKISIDGYFSAALGTCFQLFDPYYCDFFPFIWVVLPLVAACIPCLLTLLWARLRGWTDLASKRPWQWKHRVPHFFLCLMALSCSNHSAAGQHLFSSFFAANICTEVLLADLHISHQFQSQLSFGFPNSIPAPSGAAPIFFFETLFLPTSHRPPFHV